MGITRFFWPQELLDRWMADEKVVLKDDRLTVKDENRDYTIQQAVYFAADVGDGQDARHLLHRVKEVSSLQAMGGEHYMDSVIIGDAAYQVVPGFTGVPLQIEIAAGADAAGDISGAIATQTGGDEDADDRELLAKFLIDNL